MRSSFGRPVKIENIDFGSNKTPFRRCTLQCMQKEIDDCNLSMDACDLETALETEKLLQRELVHHSNQIEVETTEFRSDFNLKTEISYDIGSFLSTSETV